MADITVTPANVLDVERVKKAVGVAGEDIDAGCPIYEKIESDGIKRMFLCDNSGTSEAKVKGVAMTSSASHQPVVYSTDGTIAPGAALTSGMAYFVSNTPGGICPSTDIATAGEQISMVGIAVSATDLLLIIKPTGKVIA